MALVNGEHPSPFQAETTQAHKFSALAKGKQIGLEVEYLLRLLRNRTCVLHTQKISDDASRDVQFDDSQYIQIGFLEAANRELSVLLAASKLRASLTPMRALNLSAHRISAVWKTLENSGEVLIGGSVSGVDGISVLRTWWRLALKPRIGMSIASVPSA